ncbi:DUF6531 domain-containing protein [Pseudoalteromonas piscicida]
MKNLYCLFILGFLSFFFSQLSVAGVNLKNGNFYISYNDLILTNDKDEETFVVSRTYNSKSTYSGSFGYGWGVELDTYLFLDPRGAPIVKENGSGATRRYEPIGEESIDIALIEKTIADIVKLESDKNHLAEDRVSELKKELASREVRQAYWLKWVNRGDLIPPKPELGAEFENRCVCSFKSSKITVTVDGFKRVHPDGSEDHFNQQGKLSALKNKKGHKATFQRDSKDGKIRTVQVGDERIFMLYNESGKIIRLVNNGYVAYFNYDTKGNLIYSADIDGNKYLFTYDKSHNMTEIAYSDGSTQSMKYEDKTFFISQISKRSGEQYFYEYFGSGLNYGTTLKTISPPDKGSIVSTETIEYFFVENEAGESIQEKLITQANKVHREVRYNEKGLPIKVIERSLLKDTPNAILDLGFTMDDLGRIEKLQAGSWSREFTYIDTSERLKSLIETNGNKNSKYQFSYDDDDRLRSVSNDGLLVSIEYADNGKNNIAAIKTNKGEQLTFHYSQDNKLSWVSAANNAKMYIDAEPPEDAIAIQALEVGAKWSAMQRMLLKSRTTLNFGAQSES